MITVLIIHALLGLACLLAGDRLGRKAMLLGLLGPLSALVALVVWASGGAQPMTEELTWVPALGLDLSFRMDGFSALMVSLIGGIGVLIFAYSWFYFSSQPHLGRFAGFLVIFAGSMFGLVTADNLLLVFVFWELTSVMSYLLIGFNDESAAARSSALQALLVTGLGGLAMLAGIVILAQLGGTYSMAGLLESPPTGGLAGVGVGLVLLGAFAKSAQFPFHFWLPGAMAAPTPVSAYLHSATMVKAGLYVVARFAPVYALLMPWWQPTLAVVGLTTMIVGGWRAMAQNDMKLLLAQGTVSQLGFIMILVGLGIPGLTFAGMAMILAHSLFKGALFMVAGIVDQRARTRDIRQLGGLRRSLPGLFWLSVVSVASMVGLPPLLGFVAKEAALESLVHDASAWLTTGVVLGSMLTVAYGLRFIRGVFGNLPDGRVTEIEGGGLGSQVPVGILVSLTVATGLAPGLAEALVGAAALAVDTVTTGLHLALWHGLGIPLALSGLALLGGWAIWRYPAPRLRAITERVPDGAAIYGRTLNLVNTFADRLTAFVQSGSLPGYLLVILSVAVVAPGVLMVDNWRVLPDLTLAESPIQVVTAALVVAAAIGAVLQRRRIAAVLLLGAVGYGVAVLFVIQGAPDLALTQLLVETLALALFVLVLSRLPAQFEFRRTRIRQVTRLAVSSAVGLAAMAFTLWAASGRVAPSLAPEFIARAEPEGGGRNVVNVILTDFRALDTLGEITVLALAAMGAVALIKARLADDEGTLSEDGDT